MSPADPKSLPVAVGTERECALELLQTAYAEGEITVEDLEGRMERAHAATSLAQVRQVVADLIPLQPPEHHTTALAPASEVPEHGLVVSVMGGTAKAGAWLVPRRSFVWTMMGGTELDYREAVFGPGVHEVFLFTMWGGTGIIVPPNINVTVAGTGIMGGFGGKSSRSSDPNAPTLKVYGLALMAGAEVDVRLPGETARDARRRRKQDVLDAREARAALKGRAARALDSGH